MHPLRIEMFLSRKFEQRFEHGTAAFRGTWRAGNAKSIAATGNLYLEPALDLTQMFVKLTTKIGEAVIVGGFENNVS